MKFGNQQYNFPHKRIHEISETDVLRIKLTIMVDGRHRSCILDVKDFRGADAKTDHNLVAPRKKLKKKSLQSRDDKGKDSM